MCLHTLYKYVRVYLWAIHVYVFLLTHPHDFLQVLILLLYPILFPYHIFFLFPFFTCKVELYNGANMHGRSLHAETGWSILQNLYKVLLLCGSHIFS